MTEKRSTTAFWMDVSNCACQHLAWTVPFGTSLGTGRTQTVSSILFRSVRFALLNSEAGAAATSLPREQTEPTKAADPDIDNDKENENDIDSDNESDKNDDNDNDNNDDHEKVEKPKRGKPQNPSSFPSACVLT